MVINSDHQDETPSSIFWPEWVFNLITIIILALTKSKTCPDYRYADRSNQCLNERPDPEYIKDYTLLLSGPLLFKPMRHIADSSKNCLVIHLLQDFFAIEPRRNKMSWCGEVSSLPRRRFYNLGELVFRPSPEEIRAPLKSPAREARKLGKVNC